MKTYEILNLLSQFLAAIGTIAAVITALYLANRDRKPFLIVNSSKFALIHNAPKATTDYMMIHITNSGLRPITIVNAGWKIGIFKPRTSIQFFNNRDPLGTVLPKELKDGESLSVSLLWDDFVLKSIPDILGDRKYSILCKLKGYFKIYIATSISRTPVSIPVGEAIRVEMLKHLQTKINSGK